MTTLVDRLLVKFGVLPKTLAAASPAILFASSHASTSLEYLRDIPRYPPFMEGLPVYPPATLLATQKELVDGIRQIIANDAQLDDHYTPAMMKLAALVQLLPASQAHHHRGAGGMLRHSLEVGLWALQQTEGKLIRGVVTPQQRRVIEPRWKLTVFLAGICHDLGKVVTDISVTDRANELKWRPYNQSLYDWAKSHAVDNYFLHWQEGRGKKHTNVSSTLINAVIKEDTLDWISDGGTDAVIWLTESLNNNPGSTNQIHNFVVKADQLSVERDLKGMGVAMAGYEIGVPVERYLTDIMRRLVQEGIWRINEPSARVWNLEGTTYLVWPMAGEEIARRTRDEDIPGLPKTADGILDMMVEREIAFMREGDGDPFYYISPDVITEKIPNMRMKAIRLRDQALISSMPIAPISGKIHSSKSAIKESTSTATGRVDAQAELALNSQDDYSASVAHLETASAVSIPPQSNAGTPVEHMQIIEQDDSKTQSDNAAPAELPAPPVVAHAQEPLTLNELDGAMGELLRVLLGEFKSGKKSFEVLGVKQADGSVYLKWPDAFAGFGFAPKQILTELSKLGWMIPASDLAQVGHAVFAEGVAKSIKLSADVSCLFGSTNNQPAPAHVLSKVDETNEAVAATAPASGFEEVFQLAKKDGQAPTAKKPRTRSSKKRADKQESSTAAIPSAATKHSSLFRIKLHQSCKGKSIVKSD